MRNTVSFVCLVLSLARVASAQTSRISFFAPQVYPEGIVYDAIGERTFVSSVKTGTVGVVDGNGNYKIFYKDSTLKSSFGMKIDARLHRLWVCTGDPNYSRYSDSSTYKKIIRIIGLDLGSGKKVADINLASLINGKHFANDIALDTKGNLYITDSFSPVIYKIDSHQTATILATSEKWKGLDVGLNGIVWHPENFLIVNNNRNGELFKVDVANPTRITRVRVNSFFPGADGLLWDTKGNLVLVQNKGVNKAFLLSSTDKWASAEIIGSTKARDFFQNPTTATIRKEEVYLLNSRMNELTDSTIAPAKEFSFQAAHFQR